MFDCLALEASCRSSLLLRGFEPNAFLWFLHITALTWDHVSFSLLDCRYLARPLVNWRKFCINLLFFGLSVAMIYFENVIFVWRDLVVTINYFFDINIHFSVAYWSGFKRFTTQFWTGYLICRTILDSLSWLALTYWQNFGVKITWFVFRRYRLLIFNILLDKNRLFQNLGYFNWSSFARCLASLWI